MDISISIGISAPERPTYARAHKVKVRMEITVNRCGTYTRRPHRFTRARVGEEKTPV